MLDAALAALRATPDDMIALTRKLVEVNSFTENVAGVNTVGRMLEEAFAFLPCERRPSAKFGDHLIWRTPAQGRPIVLIGHHDTVFPPGHFEGWRVEGDRATGPGALDMKGGLAVIRAALAALDEVGALQSMPLAVISVTDEEVGSPDSTPHLKELAKDARAALVFESGREKDLIVTRRRGVGAMKVVATGKAAHAGNAHKDGANAIWALSRFVDAAQKLTDYARGMTVNVGTIKGGSSKNTVPAAAECALDLRFESVPDAHALVDAIKAAAAAAELPGTKLDVSGGPSRLPLEGSDASKELFRRYAACQRAAGLGDGEAPLVGGGSDANTVGAMGIPAIDGLGPRGAGFHTTTEFVELSSFLPKAEALVRYLVRRKVGLPMRLVALCLVFAGCTRDTQGGGNPPDGSVTSAQPDAPLAGGADGAIAPDGPIAQTIDAAAGSCGTCPSGTSCGTANGIPVCRDTTTGIPRFQHVFVVVFENLSLSTLQGYLTAGDTPYLSTLFSTYASASDYHGISHPSRPNYIAMTSGQVDANTCDCDPTPGTSSSGDLCSDTFAICTTIYNDCGCPEDTTVANIADSIEAAGLTWKAYAEDIGTPCNVSTSSSTYAPRHVPFLYYPSIQTTARCTNNVIDYSNFTAEFQNPTPDFPTFSFLTPNLTDDMHDPVAVGGSSNSENGDLWLSDKPADNTHFSRIPELLASDAYRNGGVIFFVWDEDDDSGVSTSGTTDDPIPFLIASPYAKAGGYVSPTTVNHYSLLKTIELGLGLPAIGGSDATSAAPLSDFFPAN